MCQNDWQQIFEAIEDQVIIVGLDHTILAANPAVERVTGFAADELVGKACHEVLHCSHHTPEDCPHSKMIKSSNPQPIEMEMEMLGSHYLVSISPLFDSQGKLIKTVHIARNISSLRKEKLRNVEVLHTAMDGYFLVNREGKFLDVNEATSEITGYTREELLKMSVLDIDKKFSTPEELARIMEEIVSRGGAQFDTQIKQKEGAVIDVELSITFMSIDDGQFIVFMKDIAERQLYLNALVESEKKFRTLFESTKDAIILCDSSGNINLVNIEAEKKFGYGSGELLGSPLIRLMPERYRQDHLAGMEKVLKTGESQYCDHVLEFNGLKKNGEEFPLELNIAKWEVSGKTFFSGIIRDVSGRKAAENALKESEAKLKAIFHATQDGILVADAETKIFITANNRICEMLGYSLEELLALGVQDIHPPEDFPYVVSQFERQARKEIEIALDLPVMKKDGSVFFADISSSPVEIDGKIYLVGVFRDATKRREVEERTRQTQKLEAIGTLASGIAHDFNNILSAILGYSELALLDLSPDSIVNKEIQEVVKAGNRAKELVRQILTFSRQEKGEFSVQRIQVIVKEVIKLLRSTIPTTIDIEQDIDDRCGAVLADPTQIHQLLMNLCTNAFHAMEQSGGTLQISLKEITVERKQKAIHSTLLPGRYVNLQVNDNGSGVDKGALSKIFDPYFSTKDKEKGTGLGLAVVLGVVENHSGYIQVESAPGEGSDFSVFFPIIENDPEFAEEKIESHSKGQGRVLFVDDEEALAGLAQKMLGKMGYTVTTEASSIDALAMFKTNPQFFDIVITDQTMPKMSGAELARKMLEIRPDIPIILSSGYSTEASKIDIRALGIKAFLVKPVSAEMFATTIRQVFDEERSG